MFARLKSWLGCGALRRAQQARARAYSLLTAAEQRGDDRALGHARMELIAATTDVLRLEVGR